MRLKRGAEEKKLSVKGARQKEKLYSRTWETFAYTIVAAILEDLVDAIVGPKAAPSRKVEWNERVEIGTYSLVEIEVVEVVAWEQGVLLDNKTSAKDWMGPASRFNESYISSQAKRPRTRRGGSK